MFKIINLTPHEIRLRKRVIPPSGTVTQVYERVCGKGLLRKVYYSCYFSHLPIPRKNTIFIVSAQVVATEEERSDLYSTGGLIRDSEGNITECEYLQRPGAFDQPRLKQMRGLKRLRRSGGRLS